MKILIPSPGMKTGGASTFVNKFTVGVQQLGHDVLPSFQNHFDHVLIIGDVPIHSYYQIFITKLLGRPITQRLDGVYTPTSLAGRWYWLWNLKAKIIHNFLADKIIYQSRFSKISCEKFLGKTHAQSTIIYNGVDLKLFSPGNQRKSSTLIRLVTAGMFRRRDQIEPIIKAVQKLGPDYMLSIYGAHTGNIAPFIDEIRDDQRFMWEGKKSNNELAHLLPQHDIFLFSDQSACPNVVLEAMSAGLPVVAFDRGSIRELVRAGVSGEVVSLAKHDQFSNTYPFLEGDYHALAKKIEVVAASLSKYRSGARREAETRFDLDAMVASYVKFMEPRTS